MGFLSKFFIRKPKRIKLGLALGSGGAKGFAELGALYAFEQNGIEFDIIAGSSIGSIIGAFYADGYSSTDILEMLKRVDFSEIKNFFMIKMDTSGLFNVIDRNLGSLDFADLKKPFSAVATSLDNGEEKIFNSGNVARALCASSCYPPFFKPVVIDGAEYVDGAFTNSVPSDVVKNNGADYVVGIDLSTHETKSTLLTRIFPTYQSKVKEPWEKGYQFADVMLHPDLNDFTPLSFLDGAKMYEIGYNLAISMIPKIKNDIKNFRKKK